MIKTDAKEGVVRGKPREAHGPSHEGSCNVSWGVGALCQAAEIRFYVRFVSERPLTSALQKRGGKGRAGDAEISLSTVQPSRQEGLVTGLSWREWGL